MADQYVYCEGSVQKKEAKGKWVTYYCVLRGDRLWCFSNRDVSNPDSLVGSIKMTTTTQLKKHKTKDGNYQFKIRNDKGEYRFRCNFSNDRERWLAEIARSARGEVPFSVLNQQMTSNAPPFGSPNQAQMASGFPVRNTQPRPQMEVPSMPTVTKLTSPPTSIGTSQDNLLPGQRIALEDQRRRGTSLRCQTERKPSAHAGLTPGFGPGSNNRVPTRSQSVRHVSSSHSAQLIGSANPGSAGFAPIMDSEYSNQEWFYGRIPRDIAEDYIMSYGVSGSFLLRESESSPGSYSLSFKSEYNDVRHYKIAKTGAQYSLTGLEEKYFPSIIQVVAYYMEVNEGWAQPLRRSDTGYQKHPGLRDDAAAVHDFQSLRPDHAYTAGFDAPREMTRTPSWSTVHVPMQDNFRSPQPLMESAMQSSWQPPPPAEKPGAFVPPPPLHPPPGDAYPPAYNGSYSSSFTDGLPPPPPVEPQHHSYAQF